MLFPSHGTARRLNREVAAAYRPWARQSFKKMPMIYEEAEALIAEILAPMTTGELFSGFGKTVLSSPGGTNASRRRLFGDDPKRALLSGYHTHADKLDFHARTPEKPAPELRAVSSSDEFMKLVGSFHEAGYTVRVPDVVPLSHELQRFARALECMIRGRVSAAVFWSAAGAQAPVHYDKPDNIVVQLEGRKRWYISTEAPGLQNNWMQVGEPLPSVEHHRVIDVEPGDLLYIPHGTPHTVDSTTDSLHLAIVFEPMSVRDAIIAAVDYLSDNDRALRETAIGRIQDTDLDRVGAQVVDGLNRALAHCRSRDFVQAALNQRWSRSTADLAALAKPSVPSTVTRDTQVRQSPLAIGHLRHSFSSLDFSYPGGHIAVHPGVEPELRFIASTKSFRVADLPGPSGENVKIALVARLVEAGFLEVV